MTESKVLPFRIASKRVSKEQIAELMALHQGGGPSSSKGLILGGRTSIKTDDASKDTEHDS